MKKFIFGLMVFLVGFFSVSVTYADIQTGVSVKLAGTENHNTSVYVGIASNTNNCLYDGFYFYDERELSKVLAVALTARASGKTVRVDFTRDAASGLCTGYSIYLE